MNNIFLYPINFLEENGHWTYESLQFEVIHGEASTLQEVYTESKKALEAIIYEQVINHKDIVPDSLELEGKSTIIIEIDIKDVLEKFGSTPIRKMVSLPSWLSYQAEKEGLSLSKVLQEALKERLHRNEG